MMFRIVTIVSFALLPLAALAEFSVAAEPVTVQLNDGRTFQGHVDQRTSQQRLWLRFGSESISVLRPIAWEAVVGARHQGETLDAKQLRRLAPELAADPQDQDADELTPDAEPTPAVEAPADRGATDADVTDADLARRALAFTPRVTSVNFDVYAANWDADVETDGLVLQILATDRAGRVVDVHGTIDVELLGQPRRERNAPAHRGQPLRRLAKWTRRMTPDDEGRFQLPWQAIHPEFETGVGIVGLVHVRLAVPGHGVFESSFDGVRIRPFSPVRDALQAETGRRFLPQERTGRN